ncbi:MAG TPA: potassium channel family protein [Thermoanaerobaculia bacterium]|nr:potassium channel family protein [Thermoanaerobaculia bacterium]
MLRFSLCIAIGALILIATLIDVIWTTLGTHGGGPLSKHFTAGIFAFARALNRRRPHHRLLSFAGTAILAALVAFWIVLLWVGWTTFFSAKPNALVYAQSRANTTIFDRLFFVAYTMTTMGNGDFQPNGPWWKIAASFTAFTGLAALSTAITFLLSVLSAVVEKRALGAYVSDLGGDPYEIIRRSWTGTQFDSLNDHLVQLTTAVHIYTEQHLAYPVLRYFHSEGERTAATLRVPALYELLLILTGGVAPEKRLPPQVTNPLSWAISAYAEVMNKEIVIAADHPPDAPNLARVRAMGVPTVDDETFRRHVDEARDTRACLLGLVLKDGWQWEEAMGRSAVRAGSSAP